MMRHNIPTARYKSITADNLQEGLDFLASLEAPYVLRPTDCVQARAC